MGDRIIHIEDLAIGYPARRGVRTVAEGLSADIRRGELTCLLGANGVGKSTLLRTLSAFQPKLRGRVLIDGRDIDDYSIGRQSRLFSVVLTERCTIRNMSVTELVGLGRSPYTGFWGRLTPDDMGIVDHALRQVGIHHLRRRMVHTLSDGERQKVMIAKALAQETPIIFLDEPTAFLDYPSKVEMMQLLHSIATETAKTVFLSTHDVELALQLADTVWLMDKVRGLTVGTPEDLALNGSLEGFFAGRDVCFDRGTGLFSVGSHPRTHVYLTGTGAPLAMARKALMRNGVGTAGPEPGRVAIHAEDTAHGPVYQLTSADGQVTTVRTIADLLRAVGRLFNKEEITKKK